MPGDFDYSIIDVTAHRPWPMPDAPWVMTQSWHDVLFAHWRVSAAELRPFVPDALEIDLFDGSAWLGVVPFHMTNVGPRAVPSLPGLSAFAELNVRTYVRVADRPGVYFFSLDAASWPAVQAANISLNLPYFWADMNVVQDRDGSISYDSKRRTGDAAFRARYAPVTAPEVSIPGSLEYFLVERYCLYNVNRTGAPYRLDIHHVPWPLQVARADISINSVATSVSSSAAGAPQVLHFAKRQDVVVWIPCVYGIRPPR